MRSRRSRESVVILNHDIITMKRLHNYLKCSNDSNNRSFADAYFTDVDWREAVNSGRKIIGVLAVDEHILPDGINRFSETD